MQSYRFELEERARKISETEEGVTTTVATHPGKEGRAGESEEAGKARSESDLRRGPEGKRCTKS